LPPGIAVANAAPANTALATNAALNALLPARL